MLFWYFLKLGFLLIYTSICCLISLYIYNGEKKYYEEIYVIKKQEKEKKIKN